MNEISVQDFDSLFKEIIELREIKEEKKKELKYLNEKLEGLKTKMLFCMEENGKQKYYIEGYGTFYIQNKFSVSMPKDEIKRMQLFEYLKTRDLYDANITIPYQSLNVLYKSEMEIAINEGNVDFKIPGLDDLEHVKILAMRKGT